MNAADRKAVHDALLDAFRTASDLQRVVSFGLDQSLDQIAPAAGTLKAQAFALVEWVEANGRIGDLVRAAVEENPGNEKLQALAARLAHGEGAGAPSAGSARVPRDADDAGHLPRPAKPRALASTPEELLRLMNFGAAWMAYALTTLVVVYLVGAGRAPWWAVLVTVVVLLPLTAIFNRAPLRRIDPTA